MKVDGIFAERMAEFPRLMQGAVCVFAPSCGQWLAEHPLDPFRLWALGDSEEDALRGLAVELALADSLIKREKIRP